MKQFINVINGSGELHFEGVFLSPRILREALQKKFRLITIEESNHHVRYKIIRLLRIYGGPAFFPQARLDITIRKSNSHSSLYWHFVWPEYYVFLVSIIVLCIAVLIDGQEISFPVIGFFGCCSALLVFLDTKWVSRRVRKIFKEFQSTSHNNQIQRTADSRR
jgi:hypothetical protein